MPSPEQRQAHLVVQGWTKSLRNADDSVLFDTLTGLKAYVAVAAVWLVPYAHVLSSAIANLLARYKSLESKTELQTLMLTCVELCGSAFGMRCSAQLLDSMVSADLPWADPSVLTAAKTLYVTAMPWVNDVTKRKVEGFAVDALAQGASFSPPYNATIQVGLRISLEWAGAIALFTRPMASDLSGILVKHVGAVIKVCAGVCPDIHTVALVTMVTVGATLHPRCVPLHNRAIIPQRQEMSHTHPSPPQPPAVLPTTPLGGPKRPREDPFLLPTNATGHPHRKMSPKQHAVTQNSSGMSGCNPMELPPAMGTSHDNGNEDDIPSIDDN